MIKFAEFCLHSVLDLNVFCISIWFYFYRLNHYLFTHHAVIESNLIFRMVTQNNVFFVSKTSENDWLWIGHVLYKRSCWSELQSWKIQVKFLGFPKNKSSTLVFCKMCLRISPTSRERGQNKDNHGLNKLKIARYVGRS